MEVFRRLESPKLYVTFISQTLSDDGTLTDGSLTSPSTSINCIIEDSSGTVVQSEVAMSVYNSETGKYYYDGYAIPSNAKPGIWHYECRGKSGTSIATGHGCFRVLEEVA